MTKVGLTVGVCLLFLGLLCGPAGAQPMGPGGGPRLGGPAFFENLFPPNLIMRYDSEIGLSDEQRTAIPKQMEDAQKTLVTLQWNVERESQKLNKLLEGSRIDEAAALQQADQVMNAEHQLKKAHLTLLIRIKNELTAAQQQKLRQVRPERRGGPSHAD